MLENNSKKSANKFQYKKGDFCQAKDFANNWYKSRIVELDEEENQVKVHFLGWNTRYDQWFDVFSSDLKPINVAETKDKKKNTKRETSESQPQKKQTQAPPVAQPRPSEDAKKPFLFESGTRVLAKWKLDNLFYPAHILRQVTKGMCC